MLNSAPRLGGIAARAPLFAAAFIATACLFANGCHRAGPTPPSIVLIVIDTLRADRLGIYGAKPSNTPAIDAFARNATVFETAMTTAPLTMPAMASLMTGLYPDRSGVLSHSHHDRLHRSVTTVAELAGRAGYATAAVVTNPWLAKKRTGFRRGFDVFITGRSDDHDGVRMDADQVGAHAVRLIETLSARPFFLWVHFMDTHMPYRPPNELAAGAGVAAATSAVIEDFSAEGADRQRIFFDAPYPPAELDATRRLYDACVRHVDVNVGRILDGVAKHDLGDRTIVVIAADHGESLGDHGLSFAHDFTLYDELIHVPLLVATPGGRGGRRSDVVSLVDVLPSLCALTELDCPKDLDGRRVLDGEVVGNRAVFAVSAPRRARYDRNPWLFVDGLDGRLTMLRRGRFKLINTPKPAGEAWELFDLAVDPEERSNIHAAASRTGEDGHVADLVVELERWRAAARAARVEHEGAPAHFGRRLRDELRRLGYVD